MYLNASTPLFKCNLRKEFLYNCEEHHGEYIECTVFGVASIKGWGFGFHVLLPNGAVFWRLPIHALSHGKDPDPITIFDAQYWDCFNYNISVHRFDFLRDMDVLVYMKSKRPIEGEYMFTIDWCDSDQNQLPTHAEIPDEHKCAHIIQLEDGNFCAYPNNRIQWREASFVTEPFDKDNVPDYKTQKEKFGGEFGFTTENTDKFFYKSDADYKMKLPDGVDLAIDAMKK